MLCSFYAISVQHCLGFVKPKKSAFAPIHYFTHIMEEKLTFREIIILAGMIGLFGWMIYSVAQNAPAFFAIGAATLAIFLLTR